jgi:hypothetical protein
VGHYTAGFSAASDPGQLGAAGRPAAGGLMSESPDSDSEAAASLRSESLSASDSTPSQAGKGAGEPEPAGGTR